MTSPNKSLAAEYRPTPPLAFKRIMRALPVDPSEYTFIDYGSGKGRVLLMASTYGFHRVMGVEFSPDLCSVAARNTKDRNIEIVCADATKYEPPRGNVVAFFYYPFQRPLMEQVISKLLHPSRQVLFAAFDPPPAIAECFRDHGVP